MHISIDRSKPIPVTGDFYSCSDSAAYGHVSKMKISDHDHGSAELSLLEGIDSKDILCLEDDEVPSDTCLALDFRAGLAICALSAEEQKIFWHELEPQIAAYYSKFIHPIEARKQLTIYLPGTTFSHTDDASDELQAFLTTSQSGVTMLGFGSQLFFGGPPGPHLMLRV